MSAHSPTPWRVEQPSDEIVRMGNHMIGGRPTIMIWCETDHPDKFTQANTYHEIALVSEPANAALIVRAVNSHDALVAALTDWLYYAAQCLSEFDLEDCGQEPLCARCEVAGCINRKIRNARAALVAAQPKGSE